MNLDTTTDNILLAIKLSELNNLGFTNDTENQKLLIENGNDLDKVLQTLIDKKIQENENQRDECPVCYEEDPGESNSFWKVRTEV